MDRIERQAWAKERAEHLENQNEIKLRVIRGLWNLMRELESAGHSQWADRARILTRDLDGITERK